MPAPHRPKPVVLCILDGWGYREATDNNAIALAKGANWARLIKECPWSLVDAPSSMSACRMGRWAIPRSAI
jgi:2,3-bisphosphoglycerate-independent phosphoglycerate mutase